MEIRIIYYKFNVVDNVSINGPNTQMKKTHAKDEKKKRTMINK